MTKILLTGFEPFRHWPVNSSWEAVRHLAGRRGDLVAQRLPVDHVLAAVAVRALIDEMHPEVVLLTGLADDPVPRLEQVGRPGPLSVNSEAEVRLGRWPWEAALKMAAERALPIRLSRDAGGYVCDTTYWTALGLDAPLVVFLHLPPPGPAWTPERGAQVVEAVLDTALG